MAKYGGGDNGGATIAVAPRMTSGATPPCRTMADVAVKDAIDDWHSIDLLFSI